MDDVILNIQIDLMIMKLYMEIKLAMRKKFVYFNRISIIKIIPFKKTYQEF